MARGMRRLIEANKNGLSSGVLEVGPRQPQAAHCRPHMQSPLPVSVPTDYIRSQQCSQSHFLHRLACPLRRYLGLPVSVPEPQELHPVDFVACWSWLRYRSLSMGT